MRACWRRFALSILIVYVILAGPTSMLANAQYVSQTEEVFLQNIPTTDNGNAYLFVDPPGQFADDPQYLIHDEDIAYNRFAIDKSSWTHTTGSLGGPAERWFNFGFDTGTNWGWLDGGSYLPDFMVFENTTNEVSLQAKEVRHRFPLSIGEEFSLMMESGNTYYGTFNVTDEEFFHLILSPLQDQVELFYIIFDPQGRILASDGFSNGNIILVPFLPSGEGMYQLFLFSDSSNAGPVAINIDLESVVPQSIEYGESYSDTMPGSEWVVDEDGSIIQDEKIPYAKTYSFSSNTTHPGLIRYAFNYPEIFTLIDTYSPFVHFTSGIFEDGVRDSIYRTTYTTGGDSYYYLSSANQTYYATFVGSDNIDYYVTNGMPTVSGLPVNQEFYIENKLAGEHKRAYLLDLGQDSVIRLNHSSETNGGYSWRLWTVDSESHYYPSWINSNSDFYNAQTYYLPAGTYVVEAAAAGNDASGFYEFNLGPIVDGEGAIAVDLHSLIGVRLPTDVMTFYRFNITLIEQANVTVWADMDIMNQYGGDVFDTTVLLGNRQDGVSWLAYGQNRSSYELGKATTSHSMFCDGYGIVSIAPYEVINNTIGMGGNNYYEYTLDYDLSFEEFNDGVANATNDVTVSDSPVWSNFTLGDPGDANELYVIRLNADRGVWMNISVYAEDVNLWTAYAYQNIDGCPQYLPWGALEDTLIGSTGDEAAFQFGSISTEILLAFDVNRDLLDEGSLDILITPFETGTFEHPPPVQYFSGTGIVAPALGADWLLIGGGIAVVAGVVIVAVYYFKKRT